MAVFYREATIINSGAQLDQGTFEEWTFEQKYSDKGLDFFESRSLRIIFCVAVLTEWTARGQSRVEMITIESRLANWEPTQQGLVSYCVGIKWRVRAIISGLWTSALVAWRFTLWNYHRRYPYSEYELEECRTGVESAKRSGSSLRVILTQDVRWRIGGIDPAGRLLSPKS